MIIDCRTLAEQWLTQLAEQIHLKRLTPRLGILLVGHNPASVRFVERKQRAGKKIGIAVTVAKLPRSSSEAEILEAVGHLSSESDGVIVQLPLPDGLASQRILDAVPRDKDIDGLGAAQLSGLVRNHEQFIPATLRGIFYLLEQRKISLTGKGVAILGAGQLVGRPAALAFINRGATVTVLDKEEAHPEQFTKMADIVLSATGQPGSITSQHVSRSALVLDAGFSLDEGTIRGDVDTHAVDQLGAWVTPVPGGLGALTVPALFANLVDAYLPKTTV